MKKIIPFKKDIIFKTNLSEITSISLEHTLHQASDHLISGDLIVSGEYLMTDSSTNTELFSYNLPFEINYDDRYDLKNVEIDIEDFYYEIVNNNILSVNIEIGVDKLIEKKLPPIEERARDVKQLVEDNIKKEDDKMDEKDINKEERDNKISETSKVELESSVISTSVSKESSESTAKVSSINDILESVSSEDERYVTYKVYIVREEDTIESICNKYNIQKQFIEPYNDLSNIKIGDKLIIPYLNE